MQDVTTEASPVRRKVIVFGGDGFLGSHFVEHLVTSGHAVTVFTRGQNGRLRNLQPFGGQITTVFGDFTDSRAVAASLVGQEVAVDLISSSTPIDSWSDPLAAIEAELHPSVRFFEQCAKSGVRKIVFASSGGSVYGQRSGRLDEGTMAQPFSPYSIIKLCSEHFLNYFHEKFGVCADTYRIGNLYGPRQILERRQGVIAVWIGRALAGRHIDVYGDEETLRDHVFVRDAARLMTHSLCNLDSSDTYNLGTGQGVSILDLLRIFLAAAGRPVEYKLHPRRPSDNISVILDSSKLLRHFPDFCFRELEAGIGETIDWAMGTPQNPAEHQRRTMSAHQG
jgi:UDP-glucose 4-epimerase